jgi:hypothetical protein
VNNPLLLEPNALRCTVMLHTEGSRFEQVAELRAAFYALKNPEDRRAFLRAANTNAVVAAVWSEVASLAIQVSGLGYSSPVWADRLALEAEMRAFFKSAMERPSAAGADSAGRGS